jgi:hypothetical protein
MFDYQYQTGTNRARCYHDQFQNVADSFLTSFFGYQFADKILIESPS